VVEMFRNIDFQMRYDNLLQTFYIFYMYGARVWNVEGMDGKVNDQRPGINYDQQAIITHTYT